MSLAPCRMRSIRMAFSGTLASVRLGSQSSANIGTSDAGMGKIDELGASRFEFVDEGDGSWDIIAGDEAGDLDKIGIRRWRKLQTHQLSMAPVAISAIRLRAFAKACLAGMPGPLLAPCSISARSASSRA